MDDLIRPTLGYAEFNIAATRIVAVYGRVMEMRPRGEAKASGILAPIDLEKTLPTLPTRLVSADTAIKALEYAVWCIGETIIALASRDGMDKVFALVEERDPGTRICSWLDHRWNGVTDGSEIWAA